MRRLTSLIAFAALALCAAVALAACGGGSKLRSASAPACLPSSLQHNASLPGGVSVSPAPGSVTASPETQISFLGAPASAIGEVSVQGSQTGSHSGRLESFSQSDGASFVPSKPFTDGETVTVHATVSGHRDELSFRVDTPYPTANVPPFPNPTASPSEYESFRTQPGMQAPILTVTSADQDRGAGDIFTSNGPGPGAYGALIYNPQGQLVYFHQVSGDLTDEDVNVQSYEGHEDLTFWQGKVLEFGYGDGEDLVLSPSYQVIAKVHGGNGLQADLHEFQIAPHDVAYVTAFNPIRCNLSSTEKGPKNGLILDAAIQEIDVKTGLVRWEWHALDHIAATESENSPPQHGAWDWFHINSIDPQSDGNVFISARNTSAGYQIQQSTGSVLWRLGGLKSSFKMGPGTKTAYQHDGRILPNGEVSFFDDGANPPEHKQSRAVRIALNFATREARLTSQITHSPPLLAASQGNAQTLPDGNLLIGWGGVPQISEYTQTGALLFDAHLPYPMIFYRAYRHPWKGQPAAPPTIVATLNNTGEETIVHASWNGATEVAAWRVLAGPQPSSLQTQQTVPSSSFETTALLPQKYALPKQQYGYVEVQALSSSGQVLGTSQTVKAAPYSASFTSTGGEG
ncbi:MAG: arylsulfotransferase family protein [Solirubrobacteraceae bacterium]